jgi:hypothetical protein
LTVQPPSPGAQKTGTRAAAWEYTSLIGYSPEDFALKSNALGGDLWELVSVTQFQVDGQLQYAGFFKRIKQ